MENKKRKISICTGYFQRAYGPERALEIAKEIGADAVDFTLTGLYNCLKEDNLYTKGESAVVEHFSAIREYADKIGIEIAQTHGRIHGLRMDEIKDAAYYKGARYDCIATRLLGAKHCVLHTVSTNCLPKGTTPEDMRRLNFEMFTGVIPYAKENGIKIATETFGALGPDYEEMDFFADIEEFVSGYEAVAGVDDFRDHFCYCMDTGHTNIAAHFEGQPSVADYTRRLGKAVEVLHINDNEGLTDMHAAPLLNAHKRTGSVDWMDFMAALDEIGYNGYYNLELGLNNYGTEMAIEEAAFGIKVMRALLRKHFGE